MKRRIRKRRNKVETSIESLPHEMLTQILARVASTSLADLFNTKLSCRNFLQAANDDYVFQHASMERYQYIVWLVRNRAAYLFLKRCIKSGNPEALFREGVYEYFSLGCTNSGFQLLKQAAEKKHPEATYVFSVIRLCSDGRSFRQRGFDLLSSLKRYGIRECRRNIREVIYKLWIRNIIVDEDDEYIAETCTCLRSRKRGWDDEFDILIGCCESCLCFTEVTFFCALLRNKPFSD